MAEGFILNIPQEMLDRLETADKKITQLAKTSEDASQRIVSAFNKISVDGFDTFIQTVSKAHELMSSLGTNSNGIAIFVEQADRGTEAVLELQEAIEATTKSENTNFSNSAIAKINEELDRALSRLSEIQEKLNFWASGEGSKASGMGLVNTTALEEEANQLMEKIEILENMLSLEKESAAERLAIAKIQEEIDNEEISRGHKQMEMLQARYDMLNRLAKQHAGDYKYNTPERTEKNNEAIAEAKRLEDLQQVYNKLFGKTARLYEKLDKLAAKQNSAAKASVEPYALAWRERQKVWEEGFRLEEERSRKNAEELSAIAKQNTQNYINELEQQMQYTLDRVSILDELALRQEADWAKQSFDAKDAGVNARKDYEKQVQMYEQMFDEIERLRQEDLAKAKAAEEAEALANKKKAQEILDNYIKTSNSIKKAYAERQRMYESLFMENWTVDELVDAKGSARTLNELKQYAKRLEKLMADLDPKTEDWKKLNKILRDTNDQIREVSEAMDDANNSTRSLFNTADQLKRAFTLIFSVSAIKGYIKEIAKVRGEFELQQRSLQVLLQNKDAANKIWEQTLKLAVKSPFQVKELVSYTKQLASYRVESDKLYNTTKMLADISAGLGVDMQRLILAYGQVKAANYLRGTELRQFSEAGINVLGELSKYFTTLEKRAVSVGEVFDRISKRMVTFHDVEEIFKRITSEGGMFYNMQEIQADTLIGQMRNLRDALDIMFNEIGEGNEGVLKGSVQMLKTLAQNWREVAFWLQVVIGSYTAYKMAIGVNALIHSKFNTQVLKFVLQLPIMQKGLSKLTSLITTLGVKLGFSINSMKNFVALLAKIPALGYVAAITTIVTAIIAIYRHATKAQRELKRLNKELDEMFSEDKLALNKQIKGFENLANRLRVVTKHSKEHNEIINKLNQNYGEYLGFIVDEYTTYEKLESSIQSVNNALINRAKYASYERAYSKVLDETNTKIDEHKKKIREFTQTTQFTLSDGVSKVLLSDDELNDIFYHYEQIIEKEGKLASDTIFKVFKRYGFELTDMLNLGERTYTRTLDAFYYLGQQILAQKQKEKELQDKINGVYGNGIALTAEMRKEVESINAQQKTELSNAKSRREQDEIRIKYAQKLIELRGKYEGKESSAIDKEIKALETRTATMLNINDKIAQNMDKLGAEYADLIYIDMTQSEKSISELAENAVATYKAQEEIIKEQNDLKEAGTVYDAWKLEHAEKTAEAYMFLLKVMGKEYLLNKNEKDLVAEQLQNQINLIKEMAAEYDKLSKKSHDENVIKKIRESYKATAAALGFDISEMTFDKTGIVQSLNSLLDKFPARLHTAILKAMDGFQAEIDIETNDQKLEELKNKVQRAFMRLDMSQSLEKMGINKSLGKKLFGIAYTNIDAISDMLTQLEGEFNKFGKDGIEAWKKYKTDISKLNKEQIEQDAKMLVSFLKKNLDEIQVIQDTGAYNINIVDKVFAEGKITPEQYMSVIKQIVAQTNEEVQKVRFDKFKESALYIKLMGDLSAYTKRELQEMTKTIEKMLTNAGDMNVDEVKALHDALKRVNDESLKFKPLFNNNNIAQIIEYVKLEKEYNIEQQNANQLTQERIDKEQELIYLEQQLNQLFESRKALESSGVATTAVDEMIEGTQDKIQATNMDIQSLNGELANSNSIMSGLSSKMGSIAGGASGALMIVDKIITEVYRTIKAAVDVFNDAKELAESFGTNTDEGTWREASNAFGIIGEFNEHAMEGWENLKNGNVMGAVAETFGSIFDLVRGINEAIDSNNEEGLQKQIKNVEKLEREYKKLEKQIDNAMDITSFDSATSAAENNIESRIESTKKMIALEEDKKNADVERLQEFNDELEALNEKLEQMRAEKVKELGGFGDIEAMKSATEEFIDAWMEAYKETGNGLDALEDKFNEFLQNTIKKQLLLRGANNIMQGFYEEFDKMFAEKSDEGSKLSENELEEAKRLWDAKSKDLNDFLLSMTSTFGLESGKGSLSGLEQGIAGASEETVQVVAAYLNSIRYFVADNNALIARMRDVIISDDISVNPMLAQLRIIATNTSDMKRLMESVIHTVGHEKGGAGIKVFI